MSGSLTPDMRSLTLNKAFLNFADNRIDLPQLLDIASEFAAPETIRYNSNIAQAALSAAGVEHILADGKRILPWTGAHTLFGVRLDGTVMGGHCVEDPELAEHYGSLYPYAARKAAVGLALALSGRYGEHGGMQHPEVLEYARSIVPVERPLFRGESSSIAPHKYGRALLDYVIGASGCSVTSEYEALVAPNADPSMLTAVRATLDMDFSEQVAAFMANPGMPLAEVHQPLDLKQPERLASVMAAQLTQAR